ncbi:MAG TPA: type II CAAX endopeptidase family protein [candidate division Zixibacteria bacterium]|nr:type II CAAX endopeptidase family protein [candidate division Zixibacteria bacterium]
MDSELTVAEQPLTPERRGIAPAWHTILLLVVLIAFSFGNAQATHHAATSKGRIAGYLLTLGWEYVLLAYVVWGAWLRKISFRELVGGRWKNIEEFLIDVMLAAGFLVAWLFVVGSVAVALKHFHFIDFSPAGQAREMEQVKRQIGFLAPRTNLEMCIFFALSASAGLCEEVVFRGYLQRQFGAWTRNAWMGIVLSGIVFGAGHGYEGVRRMIIIAFFGMAFGILAHVRKSLRPGMIAHGTWDAMAGLIMRVFMK